MPRNEDFQEIDDEIVGKIKAHIMDTQVGIREYEDVLAIRIKSKQFNLLIMNDYMPIIGEIEGSIMVLTPDGEEILDNVHGFFKHQHNDFTMLISDRMISATDLEVYDKNNTEIINLDEELEESADEEIEESEDDEETQDDVE